MKNEHVFEKASENGATPAISAPPATPAPAAPGSAHAAESNTAKAWRVLGSAETVLGTPRHIVDAGLLGVSIAFLIALVGMQLQAIDADLHNAVVAFGIALPLIGWGFLQASLKPKPVPGWMFHQALYLGSWAAEGVGELAAYIGILFVLWHFSFSAFLGALLAGISVVTVLPLLAVAGLLLYAWVNRKELAAKQQAASSATPDIAADQAQKMPE